MRQPNRSVAPRAFLAALFGLAMAFMLAAGGGFELDAWIMGALAGAALGGSQFLLLGQAARRRCGG